MGSQENFKNANGLFELDDLYIFSDYQRRGIGTEVIKKCCQEAKGAVYLYVFIKNERAVSLYERLGFQVVQTIKGSRFIMRKGDTIKTECFEV